MRDNSIGSDNRADISIMPKSRHRYPPRKLAQGGRVAYLQSHLRRLAHSASSPEKTSSQNIHPISEHDTTWFPLDKVPLEIYNIVQTLVKQLVQVVKYTKKCSLLLKKGIILQKFDKVSKKMYYKERRKS